MFIKWLKKNKSKDMLEEKQSILQELNEESIQSISTVQSAVNRLVSINDKLDKTTHEIEEIESSFDLIKNELGTRKQSNDILINQIKQATKSSTLTIK